MDNYTKWLDKRCSELEVLIGIILVFVVPLSFLLGVIACDVYHIYWKK